VELLAFRNRLESRRYLQSFAGLPSPEDIELHKLRIFVRQLSLVEFPEEMVLNGIADFLSAKTNRVQYAKRGLVHRHSFKEFEDALKSLWQNHREEVELDQSEKEVVRGRRLALRCLREDRRLQGLDVPADFVRGCFHYLADQPVIGWHPRYQARLNETETGDGQS
jgi:hypothetical protein